MRKPPYPVPVSQPQQQALQTALKETVDALDGVMALYGRLRLAPYPYEHGAWKVARKALSKGRQVLSDTHPEKRGS